jgi:hypothetical protein
MGYGVIKFRIGPVGEYDDAWYLEKIWGTGGGYKMIVYLKKGRIVRLLVLNKRPPQILVDRDARKRLRRILPTEFKELHKA